MNTRNALKSARIAAGLIVGLTATAASAQTPAKSSADGAGPVLAVISHPVKDYAAWKVVYDGAEPIRQKAGVTGAEVFKDPGNPNTMVIIHRFKTVAAAQGFLADPDLKAAMTKGGVTAAPTAIIAVKN
jgi:quinol monooxygenase YgiN